jgi:formate dehydrogenase maturation protein FdhE
MQLLSTARDRYISRSDRTAELRSRYPHAAEILTLYAALLEVQAEAYAAASKSDLQAPSVVSYIAREVFPRILTATAAAGPPSLTTLAVARFHATDAETTVTRWLRGEPLANVDRFLARASAEPVLEALDGRLEAICTPGEDERHCPACGGLPQLSHSGPSDEALVTGPRRLLCSRCQASWTFTRITCPGCGEEVGSQLPIYSEQEQFPHIRVEACLSCQRYVLGIDLRRDPSAVPVVDELAALPLDLYARERGLRKLTPNLMGF